MAKTVKVNIIYSPQDKDATSPRFQNDKGELWMNPHRKEGMHNISMSFYSAAYPNPQQDGDSIYIIEPRCINGGERDYDINFLKKFKYIFTWATEAFKGTEIENKIITLHHPSCFGATPNDYEERKKGWLPWKERSNEIVIIANNKSSSHESSIYNLRTELADYFHKYHKSHKVSWYGNIPMNRPYYKGKIDGDKYDILKKVKFSICTENSYHSKFSYNYFTEKLPECWLGGAVPLYMGCYNIDNFGFSKSSYIDLRDHYAKHNYDDLSYILTNFNIDDYNNTIKGIDYNVHQSKLFDKISHELEMSKIIDVFYNLENGQEKL